VSSITLRNTGNVDVTVSKSIVTESIPAGWSAATTGSPVNGPSKYALFVATAAVRPQVADFSVSNHLFNGTGSNSLRGIGSSTPTTITTSGGAVNEAYLWFRLDMPTSTSDTAGHEITMRFDGIAAP
jgi:hypothetical protein